MRSVEELAADMWVLFEQGGGARGLYGYSADLCGYFDAISLLGRSGVNCRCSEVRECSKL